jgi:hypothetical protein
MVKYLVTPKGFFEEYSDDLFSGILKAETPIPYEKQWDTMEIVDYEIEEKVELKFNKMPLKLFQQTLAFLKWCHEERKSEGMVCHRYKDGAWSNQVFPQWNTSTSVCYHPELDLAHATGIVGDTHSHPPTYGSHHSHTDSLDERKNNGIFVVVKGFNPMDCSPEIIGYVRGKKFHLKPEQFLDITLYDQTPEFPEEWKGLVGNTPCKGCDRKREIERLGKEVSEKRLAYEDDKKFRLVPKAVLEAWRTEVAKGKETLGSKVKEAIKAIRAKSPPTYAKFFRCDNYGCYKLFTNAFCPECQKNVGSDKMLESLIDILDELDAVTNNPQELDIIKEIIESEFDPKPLPPVQIGLPAAVPSANTSASTASTTTPTPTVTTPCRKEKVVPDILIVAADKPCGEGCPYKDYPHEHFDSKEGLEKLFKEITEGKPREDCNAVGKKCVYPEAKACENGCVWGRSKAPDEAALKKKPEPPAVDPMLPKCSSEYCKKAGHTYSTCDIKRTLDTVTRMCPSKECEKSGHTWHACEVRHLLIKLVAAGRIEPGVPAVDDDTKRFEVPPGACGRKECMDSNHMSVPAGYDCPIDRSRKAAEAKGTPAPYSYPETIIVGSVATCPGESCSAYGVGHKHEISKEATVDPLEESLDIPSC